MLLSYLFAKKHSAVKSRLLVNPNTMKLQSKPPHHYKDDLQKPYAGKSHKTVSAQETQLSVEQKSANISASEQQQERHVNAPNQCEKCILMHLSCATNISVAYEYTNIYTSGQHI